MSLQSNQIPVYFTIPFSSVGILSAATAGQLGMGTGTTTVYTAPTSATTTLGGAIINSLIASTDDTAAVNLFVQTLTAAGQYRPIAQINVPLSSGNIASTLMIDCLDPTVARGLPYDNTGKPFILLDAGESLVISTVANMTAAKKCYVSASGLISA